MLEWILAIASFAILVVVIVVYVIWMARRKEGFPRRAILLPVTQLVSAAVLVAVAFWWDLAVGCFVAIFLVCLLSGISDLMLDRIIASVGQRLFSKAKADMLENQLEIQSAHKLHVEKDVQECRQMRHAMLEELGGFEKEISSEDPETLATLAEGMLCSVSIGNEFCQNNIVDAVMASKSEACKAKGITLDAKMNVPADLSLSEVELCALFSNIMDNAISGCEESDVSKPVISVSANYDHGYLMVDAVNDCSLSPASHSNGRVASQPEDSSGSEDPGSALPLHGWGQRIMEEIAGRHDGIFEARRIIFDDGAGAKYQTKVALRA